MIKAFATFFGNAAAVSILEKMSHVHPRVIGWQIQQGHLSKKHVLDLLEHNWSIDFYNGQDAHLFKRAVQLYFHGYLILLSTRRLVMSFSVYSIFCSTVWELSPGNE